MAKRALLAIGNSEIENQIRKMDAFDVVDSDSDIDIITDILDYQEADIVVVNAMLSEQKTLLLSAKAKEKNVKVIAIVQDKPAEFKASLIGNGVYAFVELNTLYKIKDFAEEYPERFDFSLLSGKKDNNGGERRRSVPEPFLQKLTIAVLGSMSRIGTTTQALGLTKYLNNQGYKACYIEANDSGYVRKLVNLYNDTKVDMDIGKITYSGVDVFFRSGDFAKIARLPYQYYIYDYGDIASAAELSWQEKDMQVLCCGTKPSEIEHTETILKLFAGKGARFIFSFLPPEEHEEILSVMGKEKHNTFFASYTPDPLSSPDNFYGDLFNKKPERRLFGRKVK